MEIFVHYEKDLIYKNVKPLYKINTRGQVFNKNTGKMMRPSTSEKGYLMVSLMTDTGKQKTFKLHRIMGVVFIKKPFEDDSVYWTVNHRDGRNKKDCSIENLEWMPFRNNVQHSYDTGLNIPRRGTLNGRQKYPEELIHRICECFQRGCSNKEMRKELNEELKLHKVTRYLIHDIKRRKVWPDVTSQYTY